MCSFQISLHIKERVHTTPGLKSGGEGINDHFSQKGEKWLKKWSLQNCVLRTPREMDCRHLLGTCLSPQVRTATKVWVQPCVRAMVHFFHSARKFSKI